MFIVGLCIFTVFLLISRKRQHFLATYDPLTKLYNRNGFLEQLKSIFDKAKHNNGNLLLGTLDIDRFKAINEINGHAVGDKVLKYVALRLKEVLGDSAVLGRLGGDEFAFILVNDTLKDNKDDVTKHQHLFFIHRPFSLF